MQLPFTSKPFILAAKRDAIHVITTLRHYVHKIASENEDTLEFVSSVGDRIVVALTDEERRQLQRTGRRCVSYEAVAAP